MIRFTKEYEAIGFNAPVWQDCRTIIDTAAKQAPLGEVMVITISLPARKYSPIHWLSGSFIT